MGGNKCGGAPVLPDARRSRRRSPSTSKGKRMNTPPIDRRAFLGLAGIGGLVMASSLPGCSQFGSSASANPDFLFVQLSDLHWGYDNPKVNPQPRESLTRAIAAVNALPVQPDFVVFTGDLTQTTDDPK